MMGIGSPEQARIWTWKKALTMKWEQEQRNSGVSESEIESRREIYKARVDNWFARQDLHNTEFARHGQQDSFQISQDIEQHGAYDRLSLAGSVNGWQILYVNNPDGAHPLMKFENRIGVKTATVHSNRIGGDVEFRMLRDGTMWMSENGGNRPEDFVQIDPNRGVPGISQQVIRSMYYTMRLNQNMPIGRSGGGTDNSGLKNDMMALVDSFTALRGELSGNQHRNFIEEAFRNMTRQAFDMSAQFGLILASRGSQQDITEQMAQAREEARTQADIFANTFFRYFGSLGAERAFDTAWNTSQAGQSTASAEHIIAAAPQTQSAANVSVDIVI